MSTILVAPPGFVGDYARARSTAPIYQVYGGKVIVDNGDVPDLIDQGFNFDDPILQALVKLGRKVNITDLTGSTVLSVASQGDLLLSELSTNITVTMPKDPLVERGVVVSVLRLGTGTVTLAAASGVTLVGSTALGSNGLAQLMYLGANKWLAFGNLS